MSSTASQRVFSGVQPSAAQVHVGNYLGAMKQFVSLAKEHETIVCLVDLHALTRVSDRTLLIDNTTSLVAAYLAIGLDPQEVIIFRQSDIPEVCELAWYLSCQFPVGLLERAHSYKDAKAKNAPLNSGTMFYPILMAADILLYRGTLVPVGADQKQHLEMTREIVGKFNLAYGDVFPEPEPLITAETGVIPGLDGRKMSKSYDNYIGLFESAKTMRKKVMRIVTDSRSVEEPKDPDLCNVFSLFKLFATEAEISELRKEYQAGGMGYGHAKQRLFDVMDRELAPARERYEELMQNREFLTNVLATGAERARAIAQDTMNDVRQAVGVGPKL